VPDATKLEAECNPPVREIEYGLLQREEVPSAARFFVESFPGRAHAQFGTAAQAVAFYTDYMDLMRLAHGQTFFAARRARQLAGCLLLVMPGQAVFGRLFREGFMFRATGHLLSGRYGFSPRFFSRALGALRGQRGETLREGLQDVPHIDLAVVDRAIVGCGIGTRLFELAREACQGRSGKIWLAVDKENTAGIRLFERVGYRIWRSDSTQHAMVRDIEQNSAARVLP
jgi:ribosomal protein S18 acetylase RimI-like enzyme